MKLAMAQINPTVGDLQGNRRLVEEAVGKARAAGAEMIVLPEMTLTGYPPMDLLEREGFVADQLRELETLEAASARIPIVLGAVLRACAALRQRDVQLPSQVALLAYISQSRLAFEQYANWLGKTAPRPETAAAEVHGHSYSLGAGGAVELEYLVFQKRPLWRAAAELPAPSESYPGPSGEPAEGRTPPRIGHQHRCSGQAGQERSDSNVDSTCRPLFLVR